jgi:hypothetical protein
LKPAPIDFEMVSLPTLGKEVLIMVGLQNKTVGGSCSDCNNITQILGRNTKRNKRSSELVSRTKMLLFVYEGRIEFISEQVFRELRGFLKGINTEFKREGDWM